MHRNRSDFDYRCTTYVEQRDIQIARKFANGLPEEYLTRPDITAVLAMATDLRECVFDHGRQTYELTWALTNLALLFRLPRLSIILIGHLCENLCVNRPVREMWSATEISRQFLVTPAEACQAINDLVRYDFLRITAPHRPGLTITHPFTGATAPAQFHPSTSRTYSLGRAGNMDLLDVCRRDVATMQSTISAGQIQ